jgi:hemolysin-activating ACP:hemolysin acyltransferase
MSHKNLNYKNYYDLSVVAISANSTFDTNRFQLLKNALGSNNFELITTAHNRIPIAYVIWAKVSAESYEQFTSHGLLPRYDYEWMEGDKMIIIDIAIAKNWSRTAIPLLKKFLKKQREFSFKRNGRIRSFKNH